MQRTNIEFLPGFKGESVYMVNYLTPRDEVRLLGDRGVIVDIQTGRTAYVPRE